MSDTENHDENESHDSHPLFKPSFVLIAIDVSPSMFIVRENEDGSKTHCFKDCLTACYELADSLLLTQNKNSWSQFGIVLADNDKASFTEIETSLLETVKFLKEKSQMTNEELKQMYERKGNLDLGAFFLLCKKKFKDVNSAFYKRTIIFITNDDDPVSDPAQKFTALNEARTFEACEISFEVITMRSDFDYTKFYNELYSVYSQPRQYEEICEDKDGLFEKLSSSIILRYNKRKLLFYPILGDAERYLKCLKVDFIHGAKLYNNAKVSLNGELLKRVKTENHPVDPNLPNFKLNTPGDYEASRGKEFVFDLKEKLDVLNNNLPVGYNLVYVSKRNTEIGFLISQPSLLQVDPKEELPFFNHIWQYCMKNDKVLVCLRKYKNPDKVRFVELIPKYANNTKFFLIKSIPYATEIMYPTALKMEAVETTPQKLESINDLIERLSFDYYPKMLPNPSYLKKKAYIKAHLLDEPIEEVDDVSLNVTEMNRNLRDIIEQMSSAFMLYEANQGKKRKTDTAASRRAPSKKAK